MITFTKVTSEKELLAILELQNRNLPINLSINQRKEEGFLTVKHSLEILEKMNTICSHTIAKFNDKVVGYALSMTKDFADDIPILKPMFLEIENIVSWDKSDLLKKIVKKEFLEVCIHL